MQEHDANPAAAIEALVHLESVLEQSGWDDGYRDGLELGAAEGRDLGARIATRTAAEVGYYCGVAAELLDAARTGSDGGVVHMRAVRVLEAVFELADGFPRVNDHDADIVPLLDKIRSKFRLALVLLKMPELKYEAGNAQNEAGEQQAQQSAAPESGADVARPDLSF